MSNNGSGTIPPLSDPGKLVGKIRSMRAANEYDEDIANIVGLFDSIKTKMKATDPGSTVDLGAAAMLAAALWTGS